MPFEPLGDREYLVGYDDRKWDKRNRIYRSEAIIIKTLDNYEDAIIYMKGYEKEYPDKSLWIKTIKKKG